MMMMMMMMNGSAERDGHPWSLPCLPCLTLGDNDDDDTDGDDDDEWLSRERWTSLVPALSIMLDTGG